MRLLRTLALATLIATIVLTTGLPPNIALASELTVGDINYPCTRHGLELAINDAATNDPANPGEVTFNCANNTITFSENIHISNTPQPFAVIIDGTNPGGDPIILDGIKDDSIDTNFFVVEDDAHLTLKNITLQHGFTPENQNGYKLGGAILNYGTLIADNATFTDNHGKFGGAIYGYLSHSTTITNSTFTNNTVTNLGGAIGNGGGSLTVSQSTFDSNIANAQGGAISSSGNTTITQSVFTNNNSGHGGAIYHYDGTLKISRSSFINNSARNDGGAITQQDANVHIISSTFSGNTVRVGTTGSTIYQLKSNGHLSIYWSTIMQPKGESAPALRFQSTINPTLNGVILAGSGDHCQGNLTDFYTLSNTEGCGLTTANNSRENVSDLNLGPLWTAEINGVVQHYYPLLDGSAAINIAPPDTCDTNLIEDPDPDQLGQPRPTPNTACDIGAFESDRPPIIGVIPSGPAIEGQPADALLAYENFSNSTSVQVDCNTDGTWDIEYTLGGDLPDQILCTYPDNGTYTDTFRMIDGYEIGIYKFVVNALNADPILTAFHATPAIAVTNQPVIINATATDVPADSLSLTFECDKNSTTYTTTPVASTTGTFNLAASCIYTIPGYYTITGTVSDEDNGTSEQSTQTIQVVAPTPLCANAWTGQLRLTENCGRSETQLVLPQDGPITLCVNQWNGATHMSQRCSRSEQTVTARGFDTIPICINNWNSTLRVSDRCTRSEHPDLL